MYTYAYGEGFGQQMVIVALFALQTSQKHIVSMNNV